MPGYGDISYYSTLAQNLAAGRGFVIDYIPDFLSRPTGVPQPANSYWMPLAALIGALGVLVTGAGYVGAQAGMIAVTAFAPWVVYLLGRDVFDSVRHGVIGAWLAVPLHLFMVSASLPLTHGPMLIFGSLALWALHRSRGDVRFAKWAGVLIALAHMNRSDGVLFFGVAAVVLRWGGSERLAWRASGARLARIGLAYALAMTPLGWINVQNFGAPLPTGLARLVFLPTYAGLYSLPESVTFAAFWETGIAAILQQRWRSISACVEALLLDLGRGRGAEGGQSLRWAGVALLVPLGWLGLLGQARRELLGAATWVGLALLLYGVLYAATGPASFHAALFAFFPFLLLGAAASLDFVASRLVAGRGAVRDGLIAACVLGLGVSNVRLAAAELEQGVAWLERQQAFHRMIVHRVLEPRGLTGARIFAQQVHQLHANTGVAWVSLPFEPEPVIRSIAERLDVSHVLLIGRPQPSELFPAPYAITQSEHYELVFAGDLPGGRVGLFKILP